MSYYKNGKRVTRKLEKEEKTKEEKSKEEKKK